MWARNLTEEENYFNQATNPDYIKSPALYCYDCHDNHAAVDNDPDYQLFISSGRHIPQDVAFDGNMSGNRITYDSSPSDISIGYYETAPPNSVPPTDGSPTGGHYIKSAASGLTGIKRGDKLPCTDCHEPHGSEPTNEVFIRGYYWFPLAGKAVSNLKASTNTRSGTGNGRAICAHCHAYNDTGTPVTFKDVNPTYRSTDTIIRTPPGVTEHDNASSTPCTDCHTHNFISCGGCHGYPPSDQSHVSHYYATGGPRFASNPEPLCQNCHNFSTVTHRDGNVTFSDNAKNLASTAACDNCHSPGGVYDGVNDEVIGAKTSWSIGVYESGDLRAGKEQWCVGCHDDEPAFSRSQIAEVVVDNENASYIGTWNVSNYTSGYYGANYQYHASGTGNNTAAWTADIPVSGSYNVYVTWVANSSNADDAPYTINHESGSADLRMSQRENGGKWNHLGTFYFAAGTTGNVTLSDDAAGDVIADAVKFELDGAYAARITGDNATYGYYVTGHKIKCAHCHNSSKLHIDHEHRSYDVNETTGEAVNQYCDSYRLKDINDNPSMYVPRDRGKAQTTWTDFALCFDCHDRYQVLGDYNSTGAWEKDPPESNFWNNDSRIDNSHKIHLNHESYYWDSDWDGKSATGENKDSYGSCTACHNVHGSPTRAMIRHGELISAPDIVSTATWTTPESFTNDTYYVYARWVAGEDRASNARYTINHANGFDVVYRDQRTQGGQWILLGQFNFTSGDTGSVVLENEYADGYVIADAIGWDSDGIFTTDPEVVVDNPKATFAGFWPTSTWNSEHYGDNYQYHARRMDNVPALNFSYLVPYSGPMATATWNTTPTTLSNGSYNVSVWWNSNDYRAQNATYTIYHNASGSPARVTVDQRYNGGQWNLLGTYNFNAGAYGNVSLDNNFTLGDWVVADAVRWEQVGGGENVTVDNLNATFTPSGWYHHTAYPEQTYDTDWQYYGPASLTTDSTATLNASEGGRMNYAGQQISENKVCRACHGDAAMLYRRPPYIAPRVIMPRAEPSSVPDNDIDKVLLTAYIYDTDGNVKNVAVNLSSINRSAAQAMYDDGTHGDKTAGDNVYSYEITVPMDVFVGPKRLPVNASDSDGLTGKGDIELMVAKPGWIVVDNVDADFKGYWPTSASGYGINYKHHENGTGSYTATFTPILSESAYYDIYAWWTSSSDRATDARYRIYYTGGYDTVHVNQTEAGSQFMLLGTYYFDATSTAPVSVIVDNRDAEFVGTWNKSTYGYYYGIDSQYLEPGTGANKATFRPDLPQSGYYDVYAWWTSDSDRATNARYSFYRATQSLGYTEVNQTKGGGGWTYLQYLNLNAGTDSWVVLSDSANGYVIADAVKWQLRSYPDRVVLSDDADGCVIADAVMFDPAWLVPTIQCSNIYSASLVDKKTNTGNSYGSGTDQYVVFDLGSNYTVTSIGMYTNGNNYTWNVSLGNDSSEPDCCNYADWGTLVIEDWDTPYEGWTKTDIKPTTARYLKLKRSDGMSEDLYRNSLYEFVFDPPKVKLTYELHSPADMHIYDPEGRHAGMSYTTGKIENDIPGAVCRFGDAQTVSLPKLASGEYRVLLKGTGDGVYELTVTGESKGEKFVNETFNGNITEDEMQDATTEVDTTEATDVTITVEKPPEPTLQTVGVDNVTISGLYPKLEKVKVEGIRTEEVNTTSMPEVVVDVYSAYMIASLGSGEFALQFDDVEDADNITAAYNVALDGSWTLRPSTVNGSTVEVVMEAGDNSTAVFTYALLLLDTGTGRFPSIAGEHKGVIKPKQPINVSQLYTYPCEGTGGHTEYVRIENETWNVTATWDGYSNDWQNVTFDDSFVLLANKTYSYTIRTGSYPQIIHKQRHTTLDGSVINCTEFKGVNGNVYHDWIPAIRLWSG